MCFLSSTTSRGALGFDEVRALVQQGELVKWEEVGENLLDLAAGL
jgi:hypothetical protein